MGHRLPYTRASVELALNLHAAGQRIRSWLTVAPQNYEKPRYLIRLNDGTSLELRSLREAYILTSALASAAQKKRNGEGP